MEYEQEFEASKTDLTNKSNKLRQDSSLGENKKKLVILAKKWNNIVVDSGINVLVIIFLSSFFMVLILCKACLGKILTVFLGDLSWPKENNLSLQDKLKSQSIKIRDKDFFSADTD